MLPSTKIILVEYKSLIMQMLNEQVAITLAKANLDLLYNVKTFLGFICIIPLLECMQFLSKFVQAQDVFICDFIDIVKACEGDLYRVYVEPITNYGYFRLSLLLQITHMIFYTWFGLLNLLLVWSMQGFFFFLTHTWFIRKTH